MTIKEIVSRLGELQSKIAEAWRLLSLENKKTELTDLEQKMSRPDFWQNQTRAQEVSRQHDELKNETELWIKLKKDADDLLEMARLDEADRAVSLREDLERQLLVLEKQFQNAEFVLLFSGEHDQSNAIVSIHAGTGGVDAMDFADMLLRMYLRFCESRGWATQLIDESRGSEAGLKSATLIVRGFYAYGYLKSEHGVHRLVRISPFDAEKMRHTSFALVEVLPEFDEKVNIDIRPEDLRIDTFMSGGHGGQSVNTTYSAVRIVHLPTGITVSCQNERSQLQNKETALKILKARLARLFEERQAKEMEKIRGEYHEAAWGNQIRSYVLHPYHMVKDHRNEYESSDPEKVLNGDLMPFVEAYLKYLKSQNRRTKN
jgi:peptide chain release factor 2